MFLTAHWFLPMGCLDKRSFMKKIFAALLLFCTLFCLACGDADKGFYALKSEDNQNDYMSYTCTYRNRFDRRTRTLSFEQLDEQGEVMGYGKATYDEKGRRLTYVLKDSSQNTYLSQEFTYDEAGNQTGIYTRMLGNPDCMEYKTYENGVLVGGMLCYYGENGEIESTEIYKIQELTEGSVISYYDTSGTLIATSGYKDTYDEKGNLVQSKTYTDGSFETVSAMVTYSYEWIALT